MRIAARVTHVEPKTEGASRKKGGYERAGQGIPAEVLEAENKGGHAEASESHAAPVDALEIPLARRSVELRVLPRHIPQGPAHG